MAFTVDIRGNATHLEKTLRLAKGRIGELGDAAKTGVTALAGLGAAGAAAIGAFVVTSSNAAASIEDLALQFEVLTGSAQTSKDLLKAFRDEEKKSALNTEDYANAAKTFLAFGGSVEDTLPSLKMLADVSMGNSERFGSLALAFAQTTAAGRLMGQEVLQFVNAGFNPLEQIAKDTGKSMADLKKEMEDGKISVQMVRQAFMNATSEGGRFYRAIDKGSATTSAKLNQTRAAVTQLQVAFGTGFNEGLKDALDATNNFLPKLEQKFTDFGDFVGKGISDAVNGNTEKLAQLGAIIGIAVAEGFKASYLKLVEEAIVGPAINTITAIGNETRAAKALITQGDASKARFEPLSGGATMESYVRTALENIQQSEPMKKMQSEMDFQRAVKEGMKSGIKEDMSPALKKAINEAMVDYIFPPRFSN